MGDFNDNNYNITKKTPLTFRINGKKLSLKHKLSKRRLKKRLRTCCWKSFSLTGDYILTNNRVKQLKMYIPKYFNSKNPRDLMFSDHKPVLSEIVI